MEKEEQEKLNLAQGVMAVPAVPETAPVYLRQQVEEFRRHHPWLESVWLLQSPRGQGADPIVLVSGTHPDSGFWFAVGAEIIGKHPSSLFRPAANKDKASGGEPPCPIIEWYLETRAVEWESDDVKRRDLFLPGRVRIETNGALFQSTQKQPCVHAVLLAHLPPLELSNVFRAIGKEEPHLDRMAVRGPATWALYGEYVGMRLMVTARLPTDAEAETNARTFDWDFPEEAAALHQRYPDPDDYQRNLLNFMVSRWEWTLKSVASESDSILLEHFYGRDVTRLFDRLALLQRLFLERNEDALPDQDPERFDSSEYDDDDDDIEAEKQEDKGDADMNMEIDGPATERSPEGLFFLPERRIVNGKRAVPSFQRSEYRGAPPTTFLVTSVAPASVDEDVLMQDGDDNGL